MAIPRIWAVKKPWNDNENAVNENIHYIFMDVGVDSEGPRCKGLVH